MRVRHSLAALALTVASLSAAHADTFTITGQGQTVKFSLPSSPTPAEYNLNTGFEVTDVLVDVNGSVIPDAIGFAVNGQPISIAPEIVFLSGTWETYYPIVLFSFGEYSLFTGDTSDPTFDLGTFTFSSEGTELPDGNYNLTIAAEAPEPSSVVLLGSGVIGAAGLIRRRFVA